MTFGALFRTVATAGGAPPGAELSPPSGCGRSRSPSRPGCGRLGPLRRSAARPGFARAFERLLDELQAAGIEPGRRSRPAPATLEGSAYLGDIATLFAGYAEVRERTGRVDSHGIAREAIALLRRRRLLLGRAAGLPLRARRPHPQPVRPGGGARRADRGDRGAALRGGERGAGGALAPARRAARADRGGRGDRRPRPTPANTESALLFHLARGFGAPEATPLPPDGDLVLLRSAGVRGEAEAIAAEVSKLVAGGADPAADRDRPARPGAARRRGRGGAGGQRGRDRAGGGAAGRRDRGRRRPGRPAGGRVRDRPGAPTCCATCAGPRASPRAGSTGWSARCGAAGSKTRRRRWRSGRARRASRRATCCGCARRRRARRRRWRPRSDGWRRRWRRGRCAARATGRRSARRRAGAAGRRRDRRRARRAGRAGRAGAGAGGAGGDDRARSSSASGAARSRAGCGSPAPTACAPAASTTSSSARCRTASSRAATAAATPSSPKPSAARSGWSRGSDSEAEERYLFGVCLALPRRRLFLSYRDSDENGGAESRSPLLDEVRALLAPAPDGSSPDPVEAAITRSRDLAGSSTRSPRRPRRTSWRGRWRRTGRAPTPGRLLAAVGVEEARGARIAARVAAARARRGRLARPGPADQPGGDRLAGRGRRLRRHHAGGLRRLLLPLVRQPRARPAAARPGARPAGPGRPDARVARPPLQGAPRRRPPPPPRLARRLDRARARARRRGRRRARARRPPGRAGDGAAGRAAARALPRRGGRARDRRLRALAAGGRLRRARGRRAADPGARRLGPARGDRPGRPRADGRALVLDYKLSGSVTPREKFEEQAKLQLPLYLLAVAEHWGGEPVGGLYHPLRGTSVRRPRGVVDGGSGAGSRRLRPLRPRRGRPPRVWRSCWRTRGGGPARSSPACAPARSAATPARVAACATTTSARPSATSRRSAAATAPPSSRRTRTWRSDERAHPDPRAGGGDRGQRRRRPARGRRRHRQDRGDGRPLLPPRLRQGRLARRDPRLHLHRQGRGRAAPADPGRADAPRRGRLRARRASC